MSSNWTQAVPSARISPPWTDCGDPTHPDIGWAFAWPGAREAVALTFDRAGRRHALTLFDRRRLGASIVIHGRRFDVVRDAGDGP
jgi:hypothetical protein